MKIYHLKKFLNLEYSFADILDFFLANIRYKLYFSRFSFLIRTHIHQQIQHRIIVMDRDCYFSGSCKICGCNTPHLQMANKTCEGYCYPAMMNRKQWRFYKFNKKLFYVGK